MGLYSPEGHTQQATGTGLSDSPKANAAACHHGTEPCDGVG